MIAKTAAYAVCRTDVAAVRAAVKVFVTAIQANEPGTALYAALMEQAAENADAVRFVHVMAFRDASTEEVHRSTAAVQRFTAVLYPLTIDGVRFTDYELIGMAQSADA